jgi:ATP-dependent protease Clp ATPase subunit
VTGTSSTPDFQSSNGQNDEGNLSVVSQEDRLFNFNMVSPVRPMEILNENVAGQDHAEKTLSVAVYNYSQRLLCDGIFTQDGVPHKETMSEHLKDVEIEKAISCELVPPVAEKPCWRKYWQKRWTCHLL